MTILAAFSASRHSSAPLHLATQIARSTGDSVVAAAVVERPWPPKGDPVEQEYLDYITTQATQILDRAVSALPSDVEIPTVVHQSTSVPSGLLDWPWPIRPTSWSSVHRRRACWAGSRWAA